MKMITATTVMIIGASLVDVFLHLIND